MYRLNFLQRLGVFIWGLLLLTGSGQCGETDRLTSSQAEMMRSAFHQALALQFDQAHKIAEKLDEGEKTTRVSQLTRGIIAYFQTQWQSRRRASARRTGHRVLTELLEKGQAELKRSPQNRWLLLILGTAAIVDVLLQQDETPWQSLPLFEQGRGWLQQVLLRHEDTVDAHLGLGLLYFAGSSLPRPLSRLMQPSNARRGAEAAIHHLQRASEKGRFSRDVAQPFLLRVYAQEHRYDEVIELGQRLQSVFPQNGYYTLRTGSAQCALAHYADCVVTLSALVDRVPRSRATLARREARFDLFYTWAQALTELGQHDRAFHAYRKAINEDAGAKKDETLWAKFHLARHYERQLQYKTARQFYQTLIRGRNVDDLHQRAKRRLQSLP